MTPESAIVYSDLIKIGLPSLVAIAGVISSFVLAIRGHKKDLEIENLRSEKETSHKKNDREGDLITEASSKLTQIHDALVKYGSLYAAYIETQDVGDNFPDKSRKQLSDAYQKITDSLHLGTEAQTKIFLLGDAKLKELFANYWTSMSAFTSTHPPNQYEKYSAVTNELIRIGDHQGNLFSRLSEIYLLQDE